MHSVWRTFAALVLVPGLAVSPTLAPAHVHEADHGLQHSLVHRHFEMHDPDGTEVSHGDGHVIWLDDVAIASAGYELPLLQAILAAQIETLPDVTAAVAVSGDDAAPPHGPPRRSSSLRAPPLAFRLT